MISNKNHGSLNRVLFVWMLSNAFFSCHSKPHSTPSESETRAAEEESISRLFEIKEDGLQIAKTPLFPSLLSVSASSFEEGSVSIHPEPITAFAAALRYYHDDVLSSFEGFGEEPLAYSIIANPEIQKEEISSGHVEIRWDEQCANILVEYSDEDLADHEIENLSLIFEGYVQNQQFRCEGETDQVRRMILRAENVGINGDPRNELVILQNPSFSIFREAEEEILSVELLHVSFVASGPSMFFDMTDPILGSPTLRWPFETENTSISELLPIISGNITPLLEALIQFNISDLPGPEFQNGEEISPRRNLRECITYSEWILFGRKVALEQNEERNQSCYINETNAVFTSRRFQDLSITLDRDELGFDKVIHILEHTFNFEIEQISGTPCTHNNDEHGICILPAECERLHGHEEVRQCAGADPICCILPRPRVMPVRSEQEQQACRSRDGIEGVCVLPTECTNCGGRTEAGHCRGRDPVCCLPLEPDPNDLPPGEIPPRPDPVSLFSELTIQMLPNTLSFNDHCHLVCSNRQFSEFSFVCEE